MNTDPNPEGFVTPEMVRASTPNTPEMLRGEAHIDAVDVHFPVMKPTQTFTDNNGTDTPLVVITTNDPARENTPTGFNGALQRHLTSRGFAPWQKQPDSSTLYVFGDPAGVLGAMEDIPDHEGRSAITRTLAEKLKAALRKHSQQQPQGPMDRATGPREGWAAAV